MARAAHSMRGLRAVMDTIKEHADRTGKWVMYAFNVTDEADDMLRHHDAVVAAGGVASWSA